MADATSRRVTDAAVHVFERAGLGRAPFRIVDVVDRVGPIRVRHAHGEATIGAPGQPMGSCKYCSTSIRECWVIESADGVRFDVGCECVRKTGDAGLKRAMQPHLREKRAAREQERIDAAFAALDEDPALREALRARPAPGRSPSANALGYVEWMRANAGRSGKLRAARMIEGAVQS